MIATRAPVDSHPPLPVSAAPFSRCTT